MYGNAMAIEQPAVEQAAENATNTVHLGRNDVLMLRQEAQTVRVLAGTLWVTYNQKDVVLHPGQALNLPRGRGEAVLTPMICAVAIVAIE